MIEIFVYKGGNQVIPEDVELVRIDPSVKIIEKWAFEDRPKLRYVQFSEGLQKIGSNAFSNCVSLESIRLPSTMTAVHKGSFYNCVSVTSVVLNEGLEIIEKDAFSGCGMELLWLPSTMKYVRTGAFDSCKELKKVALNEGLVKVENYAFNLCDNLETIEVPSSETVIDAFAIPEKTSQITGKYIPFWDQVHYRYEQGEKARMEKYGMNSVPIDDSEMDDSTMMNSKPSPEDTSSSRKPLAIFPAPTKKRSKETKADIQLMLADKQEQIESLKKLLMSAERERDELQTKLNEYDMPE
ncbi:unnamed protein product [Cylindrotheca closterium]|uniref:Leucine-rich repeat domain-containing protein n=1 Tax=Cylindrotheca closterium TaxID=2856 RepID=A0AAD2FXZ1_9STRA|nr:unnamed protein product [Cylindrotheca closterium]